MLRTNGPSVNSELDDMVASLLREDLDYDRKENRTTFRDSLVRSVVIESGSTPRPIEAFSRNISNSGVGVISTEPIPERCTATLTIERLDGTFIKVLAQCRWCKPYGRRWNITGWQFLNLR